MPPSIPRLSIVCPAYEEEEVLPLFHQELSRVLALLTHRYEVEIVYVDDGSRDRTLPVLKELAEQDPRVRYLSFSRNFGHQAALTAGLEHARGDVVITLDSDLQHPPELIPQLLDKWREGWDIVLTIRADDPELSFFKRFSSHCFYRLMRWCSDTEIRFAASDFRLLSRRAVDSLLDLRETHRFLRGMVQWLGFPTAEIPFQPAGRKAGVSKYTLRKMFNFAIDAVFSFSKTPLRVALAVGGLFAAFGLFFIGGGLIRALLLGSLDISWSFLVGSLYLIGGSLMGAFGVVGEYVGRIYEQVKDRPIYLLKETSDVERSIDRKTSWKPKLLNPPEADRFAA
jgi:dolichol-phosphate mannosyltransferase